MVLLLGISIKFHWPSPSFPLAIPIASIERPHLFRWAPPYPPFPGEIRVPNVLHARYFPLVIPIKSR
jgi:hypothetical protein